MKNTDYEKYKDTIMSCPIFMNISEDDLRKMLQKNCSVIKLNPNEQLDCDFFYVVLEGSIIIKKISSDSRNVILNEAFSPAAINLVNALSGNINLSEMFSKKESTVLKIKKEFLRCSLHQGGQIALNISMFLADRIIFLNHRISSLAGYSTTSKLLMYINEHGKNGHLNLDMSISAFAVYLGVGRASLYRSFEELEEKNIIRRNGKHIEIL